MILVLIVTTCLASATALAVDPLGLYVGAGVGESEIRRDGYYGPNFNEHHVAWKAIAGIRPISPVGVELEYMDFGNPNAGPNYNFISANSDAKATALFGLGYLRNAWRCAPAFQHHSNCSGTLPSRCFLPGANRCDLPAKPVEH